MNEKIIANPAVVFTQTKAETKNRVIPRSKHNKSKFERFQLRVKVIRSKLRGIVKHDYFFWLVIVMVFINTVIQATLHHHQPQWLTKLQGK